MESKSDIQGKKAKLTVTKERNCHYKIVSILFSIMELSGFRNGRVHFRYLDIQTPFLKNGLIHGHHGTVYFRFSRVKQNRNYDNRSVNNGRIQMQRWSIFQNWGEKVSLSIMTPLIK